MAYTDHGDYDYDNDDDNDVRGQEEWEHISIPLSVEEDYEMVFGTQAGLQEADDALSTPAATDTSSGGIFQRIREWKNQRSLQRTQLGRSISNTFVELSKEDPNQMEEEAIQRAMELSMLDVALVHSQHSSKPRLQQEQQQPSPNTILGVTENASPTEIKNAYRRLAKIHVS